MSPGLRARFGIGLLSVAGTSAGHFLSYLAAAPDSHHRDELLAATGHGGESPFLVVAVAAFLATCIALLAGRAPARAPSVLRSFGRLIVLQTTAFVAIELVERIGVGASLIEAAQQPVFLLGLIAQAFIALIGALILRGLHTVATTVAVRPPVPGVVTLLGFVRTDLAWSQDVYRPEGARGPPLSS